MTVRRPRQIGTAAETAVVRYARASGFAGADRSALHGARDIGDVLLCPGVVVEVKGGDAARTATDAAVLLWLAQTANERHNAGAEHAFLVVQRKGVGPANAGRWWTFWRLSWLLDLTGGGHTLNHQHPALDSVVRLQLGATLDLLRTHGYGDPFPCALCGRPETFPGLTVCVACFAGTEWA